MGCEFAYTPPEDALWSPPTVHCAEVRCAATTNASRVVPPYWSKSRRASAL